MSAGSFTAAFDESTQVLAVSGEIDEAESLALREAIESSTRDFARPIVVDLSEVHYLPSTAVGVLAKATTQAAGAGQPIDLLAADGTIAQRVLQVCALPHRTS